MEIVAAPSAQSPARLEAAKVAASAAFVLAGWSFATWAGRIPTLRDDLAISPGGLGLVLLCGSLGSLVGMPFAGRLVDRHGAGAVVRLGAVLAQAGLVLAAVAAGVLHSVPLIIAPLFVAMLGVGIWDVAMNIEGAAVERLLGRTIMPRYHAGFSLGTVAAALLAAGAAGARAPLVWHVGLTAPCLLAAVWVSSRNFLPRSAEADPAASPAGAAQQADPAEGSAHTGTAAPERSAWTEPRTLLIGLVTLVAAFTEGSANDWVSVAFIDGHRLPEWAGVLGFATFLVAMTTGRWFGGGLLDRYGRVPVLRALFVLAGVGSLLVVFGTPPLAYVGALVWGLGVSLGFPTGMSAAADDPARAATRMSVVSTIAYAAFLVGPPALGRLGDHVGVLHALLVVGALLVVALIATPAMREPAGR